MSTQPTDFGSPWLNAVQAAVVVCDAGGAVVASNPAAQALLGFTEPGAPSLTRPDGADLGEAHPARQVQTRGLPVAGVHLRAQRADGTTVDVLADAAPCRTPGGAHPQVVLTFVEATEPARAQALSEARYRALFESMDAAVLLMEPTACVACNQAAVRLFGLTRKEELLGKTPLDFAPERQPDGRRSADVVAENVALALQKGTHVFEWESRRADGEPFTMEVRFTPFSSVGANLFHCVAIDITQRKRLEAALRQSEARFRAIFENVATGILVADESTRRFRYANPEVCRMLGYTEGALLARGVEDIHPADSLGGVSEAFAAMLRGDLIEVVVPCQRRDGSVFEVSIRAVRLELEGRPCLVGCFRDVTAAARLEEDRLRSQKLDAIAVLAGGIAHDFNNLLQGLFSTVEAAAREVRDPQRCLALLQQAEGGLRTAAGLTSQMLTFARGGPPVRKALPLAPLVENAARLALAGARTEGRFQLAPDLWAVVADEAQLSQVVQNVVLNAQQAMGGGGVVHVRARNLPEADARELGSGRWVALEVEDAGGGIAPQHLPRIFDPWFTTKERGSGLGLSVSYAIVRAHGGRIDVQSTEGRGATFTIFLPACADAPRPSAPGLRRTARVLVMDDDERVRLSVKALLRTMGYEVELAADGAAAIAAWRAARQSGRPYHALVLDLTVRDGMGGAEALAVLRQEDSTVKAIVSSGFSSQPVVADYQRFGFSAVLPKPYTADQLEQTLNALISAQDS